MEKIRFIITVLMIIGTLVLIIGSLLALLIRVVKHIKNRVQINKHSV